MTTKFELKSSTAMPAVSLPLSTKAALSFQPEGSKYTYLIRPPTFASKAACDADILPGIIAAPHEYQFASAAAVAAKTLCTAETADAAVELLGGYLALLESPDRLDTEKADALTREARALISQLTPHSAELSRMLTQRVLVASMSKYSTVRHHVTGWSGGKVTFEAGADGLPTPEVLVKLPKGDIHAIDTYIARLTAPDEDTEKN
ncbi:MAG: hypothetical protein AB7I36_08260 [Rhodospirillaceae bacterium]